MKIWRTIGVALVLLAGAGGFWLWWKAQEPRRAAFVALGRLDASLRSNASADLRDLLIMPAAIAGRTGAEQTEFLHKALADEISADGLAVLRSDGQFGPLTNIFPTEAAAWTQQAGVNVGDCVAFKLVRNGVCAEVVLASNGSSGDTKNSFRIVRCNNIKQLAAIQP